MQPHSYVAELTEDHCIGFNSELSRRYGKPYYPVDRNRDAVIMSSNLNTSYTSTLFDNLCYTKGGDATVHRLAIGIANTEILHDANSPIDIIFNVGGSSEGWTSSVAYSPADANFITLDRTSGDETGSVTITATPSENNTSEERSAVIMITTTGRLGTPSSKTITITQNSDPLNVVSSVQPFVARPFVIYPNPIGNVLSIQGAKEDMLQLTIKDVTGRKVDNYVLRAGDSTLDFRHIPSGIYILTLQGKGDIFIQRVLKR